MTFAFRKTAFALGLMAGAAFMPYAQAATPPDMLVMGMRLDDIITMDPAEVFELTAGELSANIYDRVMMFEPEDLSTLVCGVCETYEVSDDGKTINFTMREGQVFHSGNPVRAEDVVWSLQRVIKLNKTPAFIFTQFGWNADNIEDLVKVTDKGFFHHRHRGFLAGPGAQCACRWCRLGGRQGAGDGQRGRR